jgi:peroxiredoxin
VTPFPGGPLVRYGIVAAIVAIVGGLFVQRELLAEDGDGLGLLDDGTVAVGEPAPDFVLATLDGERVRLSDFRGRTVVLNFWASWCTPCRDEMPEFQSLYEERAAVGDFVVIAVDWIDSDSRGAVREFAEDFGLTFPVVLDTAGSDVKERFGVRGLPATFFIDRDGVLRARTFGSVYGELLTEGVAAADGDGVAVP